MTENTHLTRRESIKRGVALVSTTPAARTTDESRSTDAMSVPLQPADVPVRYEPKAYHPEQATSFTWLSGTETPAKKFEVAGTCYGLRVAGQDVGAISSTAVVFPTGEADPDLIPFACGRGSSTPQFQPGEYPLHRSTRARGQGLEIQYDFPDPPWQLDGSFQDVTCIHPVEDTIVSTVVHGPVTDEHQPRTLARALNSLMQTRVASGEAG